MAVEYLKVPNTSGKMTFVLQVKSWNLNIVENDVHITDSITIQGVLFRERDFLVDRALLHPGYISYGLSQIRGGSSNELDYDPDHPPGPKYVHEYVAESALIEMHQDPHFPDNKEDILYLLVANFPYEPPPQYGYPVWPNGRHSIGISDVPREDIGGQYAFQESWPCWSLGPSRVEGSRYY
jgi:hypothetical protein